MLPKTAKKVFSGVIFDVYQWQQKMFDGSKATFERIIRQNTVVIIATAGNKIILLKQKQPNTNWYYDLPSGRMDKAGEKPKTAAARELLEETGLKAGTLKLWKIYTPRGKIFQKVYFFVAQNCKKISNQNLDNGEKIKVLYETFDEFLKFSDRPNCYLGPLTVDVLLARIHRANYRYLQKVFFKNWAKPPKQAHAGPKSNW